jgi:hypothetical protein
MIIIIGLDDHFRAVLLLKPVSAKVVYLSKIKQIGANRFGKLTKERGNNNLSF